MPPDGNSVRAVGFCSIPKFLTRRTFTMIVPRCFLRVSKSCSLFELGSSSAIDFRDVMYQVLRP